MLKPLSQKTLKKKYEELGLPQNKIDLLHKYFLCFSNLYGVISIKEAWNIFKYYNGIAVHKKDFAAFSGIVQREAGLPYSIYEIKEIYREEINAPLERMIVNKNLVSFGYNRFYYVYNTIENGLTKPYYLPKKTIFESFTEDRFYLTPYGKKIKRFIENLTINDIRKNYTNETGCVLSDLNGTPVKGKRLCECVFYTQDEQFELEYFKDNSKKQKLVELFNKTASEKILNKLEIDFMNGGNFTNRNPLEELNSLIDFMKRNFGVELTMKQSACFTELYVQLYNNSNLWRNCGWSPNGLSDIYDHSMPPSISIGPNMKKMFESGELNRDEFEKQLAQTGITLADE